MALTTIKTASIGDDQVTVDKLANAINTDIAANTTKVTNATHTGDVTGGTALTIAADAVETGMIADVNVTTAKIADDAVTSAKLDTNIDIAGTFDVTGAANFDSYINTSNNVWIGDRYANNAGVVVNSYGEVSPTNTGTGSGDYVWRAYNATGPSSLKSSITSSGDAEFVSVADSKGDVRKIPANSQGSSYTLVAADAGKYVWAGNNVEIPNNIFSAGDAVTIVSDSSSDITITKTIATMYMASDGTNTATRTLAKFGVATILFVSGTACYITGAGLS